jgi:hypothetical protein
MSVTRMMTRTATIHREIETEAKDRGGNALMESAEEEVRCAFQQKHRAEHEDGGEISDTLWTLYLPFGTEIDMGDSIVVEGRRYEVVGEPWSAQEGSRSMWHLEASVQRTAGAGGGGS